MTRRVVMPLALMCVAATVAAAAPPDADRTLAAEHGVVCRLPGERFGYFGWPTVARLDDGRLVVVSSGLRAEHVCPFGKTVLHESKDNGHTWSESRVIQDSLIDDRDAGVVNLGGESLLVSWFRSDTRPYATIGWVKDRFPAAERETWPEVFKTWTDAKVEPLVGSWVMRSDDGGQTWGQPVRVPVSTPHGPIRLADGDLLYVGKPFGSWGDMEVGQIAVARSGDGGASWKLMGRIPVAPRTTAAHYHEPHVVELPSGRLVAAIRVEEQGGRSGMPPFTIMQSESADGGGTWSVPRWVGFKGSPPHLVRHSTGALVMTYGYREQPYGQRVAISRDDGKTWQGDWILRGDGPDDDLGYPSTVELADGSLFTVCYQKAAKDEKCSLLWSKWKLPAAEPAPPVAIGSRRELFVDRSLIDTLNGATLKLHEPVSAGTAITIDKPWEGPANFGASVLQHGGRFLLYYRAVAVATGAETGGLCVAVSNDGVTWTKPALDQEGRNVVAADDSHAIFDYNSAPWVDTRPGVPETEIIKAITSEPLSGEKHTAYIDPKGPKRLGFWGSADGLTFRRLDPQPDFVSDLPNSFDGGNTMFWSEVERQYVLCYRFWDVSAKAPSADVARLGGRGYRSMACTTSKDFMTWTKPVPMTYGDSPREQFYVNNTQPYFRSSHLYVAPAARFMEGRQVLDEKQAEAVGLQRAGPHVYFKDCSDAVLLTSRAGSTVYDRTFMETFIRPGLGDSNWVSRTNYPLTGILPAGDRQIQLFVSRNYMQPTWHIERLLLRTDGFASLSAPWAGGEMVTKPLTFAGTSLEINYRTGAAGSVRIEIQDADGTPLAGFTAADCPEIIGDEIERAVAWKAEKGKPPADLGTLTGKPVRLKFILADADVFSFRFR